VDKPGQGQSAVYKGLAIGTSYGGNFRLGKIDIWGPGFAESSMPAVLLLNEESDSYSTFLMGRHPVEV
jgi:hypothetical protein